MFRSLVIVFFSTILIYSCQEKQEEKKPSFTFNYNCDNPILKSALFAEDFGEKEVNQMVANLKALEDCGLDSMDFSIMTDGQVLGSLIVAMGNPETKSEDSSSTYMDLIMAYQTFTSKIDYAELVNIKTITQILSTLKIDYNKWDQHVKYFEQLDVTQDELAKIKKMVEENHGRDITYTELSLEMESKQRVIENKLTNLSKDEIISLNQETEKELLILFSAVGSPNSMRFEEFILTNPQIIDIINSKFQLIELNCEDRNQLPETAVQKGKNNDITTYGQRNAYFQLNTFGENTYPMIVRMNKNGSFGEPVGYSGINNFLEFLHKE